MTDFNSTQAQQGQESRNKFRRYAVRAAVTGEWIPWAEFVDRCWSDLTNRAGVRDGVGAWHKCREPLLTELAGIGLAATVVRTDASFPIERHEADLSGLVRLHLPGYLELRQHGALNAMETAYTRRMYEAHGLTPCDGLPRSLRGFCGQVEPVVVQTFVPGDLVVKPKGDPWMDHTRAWLDTEGLPVLTTEPYGFDPLAVARELGDLPLHTEVCPGVWNPNTTLLMLRWDCESPTLPAEHRVLVQRIDYKTLESVRVYV